MVHLFHPAQGMPLPVCWDNTISQSTHMPNSCVIYCSARDAVSHLCPAPADARGAWRFGQRSGVLAGRQDARVGFRRQNRPALGRGDRRAPADARGASQLGQRSGVLQERSISRDRPRAAEYNRKLRRFKQLWRPETCKRFSLRWRRLGHKKWEERSLASCRLSGNMCGGSWSYTHPRTCLWPW